MRIPLTIMWTIGTLFWLWIAVPVIFDPEIVAMGGQAYAAFMVFGIPIAVYQVGLWLAKVRIGR